MTHGKIFLEGLAELMKNVIFVFVTFQATSYTMDLFVVIVSPSLHTYFTLESFSFKWIGTFKFGSNNFNIKYINRLCYTPSFTFHLLTNIQQPIRK